MKTRGLKLFLISFSIFACGSFIVSCGSRDDKSSPKAVDDIVSVQRRDDGSFDVICRDGSRQIASAEQIRNNAVCGNPPSPGNGSQPVGDCLTAAKAVFGQRRGTSTNQDIQDALDYCRSGRSSACLQPSFTFFNQRRGTSTNDDINSAVSYCRSGGKSECLTQSYPTFSARRGTTYNQDIDDTGTYCTPHN